MEKGLFILSSPYFYTSILQSPCLLECFVGYIVMVILQVTHYQGESVAYKKNHVLCTPLFPGDYVRRLCSASMINNLCESPTSCRVTWDGNAELETCWLAIVGHKSRFPFLTFHISFLVSRFSHLVSRFSLFTSRFSTHTDMPR